MFIDHATVINILGIDSLQQHNHNHISSTSRNSILPLLSLILPLLLDLINLKFQKEADSVFYAHPITIKVAITGLLVFALAFGIDFTFHSSHLSPTCAALLRTTMVFSGYLSLASLASLLFPDACRPLIYLMYVLLSLSNYLYRLIRKWCEGMMHKLQTLSTGMTRTPCFPIANMDYYYTSQIEVHVDPQVPEV